MFHYDIFVYVIRLIQQEHPCGFDLVDVMWNAPYALRGASNFCLFLSFFFLFLSLTSNLIVDQPLISFVANVGEIRDHSVVRKKEVVRKDLRESPSIQDTSFYDSFGGVSGIPPPLQCFSNSVFQPAWWDPLPFMPTSHRHAHRSTLEAFAECKNTRGM